MTLIRTSLLLTALLLTQAPTALAGTHYRVTILSTLGGGFTDANGITNLGRINGSSQLPGNQTEHAVTWTISGRITDLRTLGGSNSSAAFPVKDEEQVVGNSQVSAPDQLGENFCAFTTCNGIACQEIGMCRAFVAGTGYIKALPLLGGNNSWGVGANSKGKKVGISETDTVDPTCAAPQVLDYAAVVWDEDGDSVLKLEPLAGDKVGGAAEINDRGQIVGATGACGPVGAAAFGHAILWDAEDDYKPRDLGNFGGAFNNVAVAINNSTQIVGWSDLPADAVFHAFLWQKGRLNDLGTLPGDIYSFGNSINEAGTIVGQSCDANFNCRATLWHHGVIADLNTLVPAGSPSLVSANDINNQGQIVGSAIDPATGNTVGFLASPDDSDTGANAK